MIAAVIWLLVFFGLAYLAIRAFLRRLRALAKPKTAPRTDETSNPAPLPLLQLPQEKPATPSRLTDRTGRQGSWLVVCNMSDRVRVKRDGTTSTGSTKFAPGTKLYLGLVYHGMAQRAHFIGKSRRTKKLTNGIISMKYAVNARVVAEFSPSRLAKIEALGGVTFTDKKSAFDYVFYLQHIHDVENGLVMWNHETQIWDAKPGETPQGNYPYCEWPLKSSQTR